MPPKKKLKVDNKPKKNLAKPASSKPGRNLNKEKERTPKAPSSKPSTRSKGKATTSKILEEAAGAGIRSTEELQDYMQQIRTEEGVNAVSLTVSEREVQSLDHDTEGITAQSSNNATPTDGEDSTDSESSFSSSESEDENDEKDQTPSPPVKRKLPFNQETQEFRRVEISPASLEDG